LSKEILYFGYGSNLSQRDLDDWKKGNPKYAQVDLNLKKVSIGYLPGYRLGFTRKSKSERRGFMGVADIVPSDDPMSRVWGVIFSLTPAQDRAIAAKEGSPTAYRPMAVGVTDIDGVKQCCLTYQAVVEGGKFRKATHFEPHKDYIKVIHLGGKQHQLPQEFFEHLEFAKGAERNSLPEHS
jgi:hypothetical protein